MRRHKWLLWCGCILLGAGACTLPDLSSPTPFIFPTPDLTLTAVFSPIETVPPTVTPPIVQTATSIATSTTEAISPTPTDIGAVMTATASPAATQSGVPDRRPGVSIQAERLGSPPTIDGDLGDWGLNSYAVESVVYGPSNTSGEADLSGTVMVGWDDSYLYLAARVRDDTFIQNARGINLFKGDSVEILIDTRVSTDYYVRSLSPDDFQLGISPGSPQPMDRPEAYLWYPRSITGSRSQVIVGAERTDDGYTVEAAIPWGVFELTPVAGGHYGFAFSISDNDLAGESVQQSMVSTISTRRLTDPTTWGDLTLKAP